MLLAQPAKAVVLPPVKQKLLPFKYPADATNYFWDLQFTRDLQGPFVMWQTLVKNTRFPATTNGDITIAATNKNGFYRMRGHKEYDK